MNNKTGFLLRKKENGNESHIFSGKITEENKFIPKLKSLCNKVYITQIDKDERGKWNTINDIYTVINKDEKVICLECKFSFNRKYKKK